MKALFLTALFLFQLLSANSQDVASDMNRLHHEKAKPHQQWLMRFEKVDTTDSRTGRKFSVSRSYYFNKARRQLQTVQIQEVNKRHGLAMTYSFYDNKLTKVTVTPPRSECRKCSKSYYFWNNKLHISNDTSDLKEKAHAYIKEAAFLKNKMPDKLEPCYFEWEPSEEDNKNQEYLIVAADDPRKP
jgi:hypothetical protein